MLVKDTRVSPSPGFASDIRLGRGIDLSDPLLPIFRHRGFNVTEGRTLEDVADLTLGTHEVRRSETDEEEASSLAVNFRAKYGFVSGAAAFSKAKEARKSHECMYLHVEYQGPAKSIDNQQLLWAPGPEAENISDIETRRGKFLAEWGSHYITSIVYGWRIVVRATVSKSNATSVTRVESALKAAGGIWQAGGALAAEHRESLRTCATELAVSVVAGNWGAPPVFSGYEGLQAFLNKIENGAQIPLGPVSVQAQSYWHTLTNFPKCEGLFAPQKAGVLESPFGVPVGTVIAWSPPAGAINLNEAGQPSEVVTPDGWAICDGNGTPDLRGMFVRGASVDTLFNSELAPKHGHTVRGQTDKQNPPSHTNVDGAIPGQGPDGHYHNHGHNINIETTHAEAIPPHYCLLYLIKLHQ